MSFHDSCVPEEAVLIKKIVHARMDLWSAWSQCSKSCRLAESNGNGIRTRSRKCINQQNGGMDCEQLNYQHVCIAIFQIHF